jgi:hypothetical protein
LWNQQGHPASFSQAIDLKAKSENTDTSGGNLNDNEADRPARSGRPATRTIGAH